VELISETVELRIIGYQRGTVVGGRGEAPHLLLSCSDSTLLPSAGHRQCRGEEPPSRRHAHMLEEYGLRCLASRRWSSSTETRVVEGS
jgi:hypothetical protein